jgi:hypothetical protein
MTAASEHPPDKKETRQPEELTRRLGKQLQSVALSTESDVKTATSYAYVGKLKNPTHTAISQMRGIPHLPGDVVVLPHLPVCHTGMGSIYIHRLEECAKAHTPRLSHEKKEARPSASRSASCLTAGVSRHTFFPCSPKRKEETSERRPT